MKNEDNAKYYVNNPFEFAYFPDNPESFNGIIVLLREPGGESGKTYTGDDKEECIKNSRKWAKEVCEGKHVRYHEVFSIISEYCGDGRRMDDIALGNIKWTPGGSEKSQEYGEITYKEIDEVYKAAIKHAKEKAPNVSVKAVFVCWDIYNALENQEELQSGYIPTKKIVYNGKKGKREKRVSCLDGVEIYEIYHPSYVGSYFTWE